MWPLATYLADRSVACGSLPAADQAVIVFTAELLP